MGSTFGTSKSIRGSPFNTNNALFKTREETANAIIPPQGHASWIVVGRTRGGEYPAPECRVRNNTTNDVDKITIEGCGIPIVNGVYERSSGRSSDRAPVYIKKGMWKGAPGEFEIYLGDFGGEWSICFMGYGPGEYAFFYEAPTGQKAWMPPNDGWAIRSHQDGVHPAPKLI